MFRSCTFHCCDRKDTVTVHDFGCGFFDVAQTTTLSNQKRVSPDSVKLLLQGQPSQALYIGIVSTGWAGASLLRLGEIANLICNSYLSVAARATVWADPSRRCTSVLLRH